MTRLSVEGSGERTKVEGHATPSEWNGQHLWLVFIGYHVLDAELAEMVRRDGHLPAQLGPDRIASGPDLGCYHCEQKFHPWLLGTTCPGEPGS